jgi:tRNA threonylcarbamoyladenosine biosynthesis protein TsaB
MKILAIETATALGGVALIDDEKVLAEYGMDMTMAHGEKLMVMVDRILKDIGLGPNDLDALAVSIGPGSFTGLRVGVSTVKGLATGTPIRIAAVPTLEAMAWNAQAGRHFICPMIDAKKGEVYTALFSGEGDGILKRVTEDQVLSPEVLCERVRDPSSPPTIFLGDGASKYREVLVNRLGRRALFPPAPLSRSLPSIVAWLGLQKLRRGEAADARTLAPVYVRRPDAEVNWEKGVAPRKLNLSIPTRAALGQNTGPKRTPGRSKQR